MPLADACYARGHRYTCEAKASVCARSRIGVEEWNIENHLCGHIYSRLDALRIRILSGFFRSPGIPVPSAETARLIDTR